MPVKPFHGTAEAYLVKHARWYEQLFVALIFGWAACGPVACAHTDLIPAAVPISFAGIPAAPAPHVAAACLSACTGATYAEVSPKGDLCRCWAPNAFQYTFSYPATPEAAEYPRERWQEGIRIVRECTGKGWAWEADETGDHLRCVQPSGEHGRNYEVPSVIPRRPDQSGRRT